MKRHVIVPPLALTLALLAPAALSSQAGAVRQRPESLLVVANIALQDRQPVRLRAALLALRSVARKPAGRDPAVQLDRVRLERMVGNLDSATRIVTALLVRQPANPAVLMEAGHTALSNGDVDTGTALWFRGLVLTNRATLQAYRSDLLPILPDSVLHQFDTSSGEARTTIIRHFFSVDEFGQLRSPSQRLREHYRRLDHARGAYSLPMVRYVADTLTALRPEGDDLDDRGLVWVLHGPPDDHTHLNQLSAPPNESWHYKGDDGGELLFHFIKTDDVHGYHRVASIFDILALTKPLQATGHSDVQAMAARGEAVQTYGASWTAQTVQDMLYSRESMSPTYAHILSAGNHGTLALENAERVAGDSSIAEGETAGTHYELPLEAQFDAVATGSDSIGTYLQVAFAIPGTSLYAPPSTGPVVYPVRMRVSVIRRGTGEVVAAIDTLRNFVAAVAIPPEGTLVGRLPIRVPPGDFSVRIALETPGRGVMSPRLSARVAPVRSSGLDLSDLALGARSVYLPWRTPQGDSVWVNPLGTFRASEPMQLYFEAMGITPGAPYKGELNIFKSGAPRPELRFAFNAIAVASPDAVQRTVDLGRLKPGSYRLEVTVSNSSGTKAVRQREFTVVK